MYMDLLCNVLLIFMCMQSYVCLNNVTYAFSHLNTTEIQSILSSNNYIITNSSYVKHLPLAGADLLDSIKQFLSSTDIQSVAFTLNTGDCSLPLASALKYQSINISFPICFSKITSYTSNILQLVITNEQLVSAATIFMNHYSLSYFSMLISESSDFYFNLAQEFSTYMTEKNFILEQTLLKSNFPPSSGSLRSKGEFISAP